MSVSAIQKVSNETEASTEAAVNQYLAFILAGEEYGVDILRVQEIKGWTTVTQMPNMPPHVKGVLNLRGTIVPIIDLRLRFGLEPVPYGATTVIVVLIESAANVAHSTSMEIPAMPR